MTVTTSANTVVYRGNGSATSFAVPFKVLDEEHLVVRKRDYDSGEIVSTYIGTDYSYSGIGDSEGTLTLAGAALSSDYELVIERIVPYTQDLDIVNSGGFYPETVEERLDLITMGLQQLANGVSRSLKVAVGDEGVELPNATNKYLILNEDGELDTTATALALTDFIQAGADAVTRSAQNKMREIGLTPEDFGAVGDGVTDDTDAFQALALAVNTLEGGVRILIPAGKTYIVGRQTFAGAMGLGYSYTPESILAFENCTKPIYIELHGTIKQASGQRYGSFHPVTGAVYNPGSLPFVDTDYRASLSEIITAVDCSGGLFITGKGTLDGNDAGAVLGGLWGDTGRQLAGSGVGLYATKATIAGPYLVNHCLDGLIISHAGLTEAGAGLPIALIDIECDKNGRQGVSWVGGRGLTAIGCRFLRTGRGASGIQTSPGAGFDIEAESSICRDGHFINCIFAHNSGVGMVADSGDSADMLFEGCKFYGTGSYSVWPKKPRFTFRDCLFSGTALGNYGASNRRDRTRFLDCSFEPVEFEGETVYSTILVDLSESVTLEGCRFHTEDAAVSLGSSVATVEFIDCSFLQNGSADASTIRGKFYGYTKMDMTTGSNDCSGSTLYSDFSYTGTVLSINGAGGKGSSTSPAYAARYTIGGNSSSYQLNVHTSAIATPGDARTRGDLVWNTEPSVGGNAAWIATASGTPATFQPVGVVGMTQGAAVADGSTVDQLLAALRAAKIIAT